MSTHESVTSIGQPALEQDMSAVVDDWENIAGEQFQQLTNERLSLAEQQQKANVVEQQIMKEQIPSEEEELPASMINKPIKILRREQPRLQRAGDQEARDEAALLEKLTLDERKANYDKIRERIFNAAHSEDKADDKETPEETIILPEEEIAEEPEATTSSEVLIETINHLSNVKMLSEQTPRPNSHITQVSQPKLPEPLMTPQEQDRTLHIGNLDHRVTEDFICALFGQIGPITGIRLITGTTTMPYALVQFIDHNIAAYALQTMDKREVIERPIDVKWVSKAPALEKKVNTNQQSDIFVGDLSSEVDNEQLKKAFAQFGEVAAAKVIMDPHTLKSKGYGFISFQNREDAERAIEKMNGQIIGKRTVRTNWASRKNNFGDSVDDYSRYF